MKKLLFLSIFTAIFAGAQAQPLAETNTTITKGYGNFSIENVKYPLGSVIMNVRSGDTSMIELDFLYQNGLVSVIAPVKKRVKYINGTTGLPFASIGAFRTFYDSFMVEQPSSGGGGGGTENQLAGSWAITPDGSTYTFTKTVPAGYTYVTGGLINIYNPGINGGIHSILNLTGTTLTATIWINANDGTNCLALIGTFGTPLLPTINYLLSK